MKIPENIRTGNLVSQIDWLTTNFTAHTWNSRDSQPLHLAEFFAQNQEGEWINLSVLNSGEHFVKAVIKAITKK